MCADDKGGTLDLKELRGVVSVLVQQGKHLAVHDPSAGGHPLHITRTKPRPCAHGIAVSLDVTDVSMQWSTAVHLVPEIIERLAAINKGRRVINLNAPNLPLTDIKGVEVTGLAKWGDAAGELSPKGDGLWSFERKPGDPNRRIAGTDNAAVREGFISVSELVGIRTQQSDLNLKDIVF